MSAKSDSEITNQILGEKQHEEHARQAKQLLEEYSSLMLRMQEFVQSAGGNPQGNPIGFCESVLVSFAIKRLENRIVNLSGQ